MTLLRLSTTPRSQPGRGLPNLPGKPGMPWSYPTLLFAVILISIGVLTPVPLLRATLVLPAALLAPGYAFVITAFGARPRLDTITMLILSIMLSMALYPLLALALYAARIPLSTPSVVAGTDCFIAMLVITTALRDRLRVPTPKLPAMPLDGLAAMRSYWSGKRGGLAFAFIITFVIATLAAAIHVLPKPADPPYTQFYLTGRWAHVDGVVSQPRGPFTVSVGLSNHTSTRQTYRIAPQFDSSTTGTARVITLAPTQTWIGDIRGQAPASTCIHRFSITLYSTDAQTPLNNLIVWTRGRGQRC